jgi:sec-independent protein translocase protein TatB
MFEVAWSELLIVAIVAIVVVGPKELPGLLRTLGRIIGKLRRQADEFRRQFDESMRDAGGEDLKRELDQLRYNNPLNEIRNTIESAAREVTHPPLSLDTPTATTTPAAPAATATEPAPTPAAPVTAPAPEAPASPAPTASENTSTPAQPHVNGADRPL